VGVKANMTPTEITKVLKVVPGLVAAGFAVLSYDKRGVGQSEGACCPGDQGHFNLLTADVEGAIGVWSADDKPLSCQSYRPDWAHPRETSSVKPRRPGVLLGVTVESRCGVGARCRRSGMAGASGAASRIRVRVRPDCHNPGAGGHTAAG
jgi:hypothetical protein